MRKGIIATLALFMTIGLSAQKVGFWFDTGLKAGTGLSLLQNNNIFSDREYEHLLSSGYSLGGKVGIFYGYYNGVNIDAMFTRGTQKFEFVHGENQNANHSITWSSLDIALLYRMQKASVYVELGPQMSFVNSVTQTIQAENQPADIKKYFNDQLPSAVFGVGGYVFTTGTFTLMFGMRAIYGLTDMISAEGKSANYPNPLGTKVPYDTYEQTHPVQLLFMLEANYGIGYFAKTTCSDRMTFFKFN